MAGTRADGAAIDAAAMDLVEVVQYLRGALDAGSHRVSLLVADPDRGAGLHAGARFELDGERVVHRPWSVWVDLASRLHLRLATPDRISPTRVRLRFERLVEPAAPVAARTEKYGTDSPFARIHKAEDPSYLLDLADALDRAPLPERPRVLFLGVNRGDEIATVRRLLGRDLDAVGVDHSASAIAEARRRHPDAGLVEADVAALPGLELGRFDLVVAIDVLHSPSIDDGAVLHHLVHERLHPTAAVCLGVPNCLYLDGERLPGARTRNATQPELTLLFKKVSFYRRYLAQHRFRVFITGQHEILVTGVRQPTRPTG